VYSPRHLRGRMVLKSRSSASRRSCSGIEAKRSRRSVLTMARSSPAFVQ